MMKVHVLFVAWSKIRLAEVREPITKLRNDLLRKGTRSEIESLEQVSNKLDALQST